ncbi:Uncharacterised protein [Streptococcus pneumoniae]|nr:Uncharacterised protein [Streptococcus pneumoniae]
MSEEDIKANFITPAIVILLERCVYYPLPQQLQFEFQIGNTVNSLIFFLLYDEPYLL